MVLNFLPNLQNRTAPSIKFLQLNKTEFHTYQLKVDRTYRVALRNLNHTTPIEEMKNELHSLGQWTYSQKYNECSKT